MEQDVKSAVISTASKKLKEMYSDRYNTDKQSKVQMLALSIVES